MAGGLAALPAAASGAPPWSAPVDLSTSGAQLPSDPVVAVGPRGRAVVAWWRRDSALAPTRDVVQVSTRASWPAAFLGPRTLSRLAANPGVQPALAATDGPALTGWTEGGRSVALRTLSSSGRPQLVTILDEGPGAAIGDVAVGIAPSGAAVAVWTRDPLPAGPPGGDSVVRVATRSASTGTWTPAGDLSPAGARRPSLAVAPDGSSVVAWTRGGAVEAALGDPAGSFVAPVPLSAPGAPAGRLPVVAVNGAGDALVAWNADAVTVVERDAGGPFTAPVTISPPGGVPVAERAGGPLVAIAADGRSVGAWRRRSPNGRLQVEAAVRPAGGAWAAPTALSPAARRDVGRPALGADAAGHAVVAWSQPIGARSAIRARAIARSAAAFGTLEAVSAAAGRGTAPAVGLDAAGRAVLAWREDPAGGDGHLFRAAVRFSPG